MQYRTIHTWTKITTAVLGLAFLSGCGGSSSTDSDPNSTQATYTPTPFDNAPAITQQEKSAYLDAVNAVRAQPRHCGNDLMPAVDPLAWSDALYKAAAEHNADMAHSNIINADHVGSATQYDWTANVQELADGSRIDDRAKNNGYLHFVALRENVTAGTHTDTIQKALDAWLASEGHCKNIMDPAVDEVGIAHLYVEGSTYSHYWTQVFGKR